MKKIHLIFILGVLIFACVMSSGCIGSDSGPSGLWNMTAQSSDATYIYTNTTMLFNEDGTGMKTFTVNQLNTTFTRFISWTALNKTTYDCLFMEVIDLNDNETVMTIGGPSNSFSGNGFIGTWSGDLMEEFDGEIYNEKFTFNADGTGSDAWYFQNGTRESNTPLAWSWYETEGCYVYYEVEDPYTGEFTIQPDGTGFALYHKTYWETYERISS